MPDLRADERPSVTARRWCNRGGGNAFNAMLDRKERDQQAVEMMKVVSDKELGDHRYFNTDPTAFVTGLRRPEGARSFGYGDRVTGKGYDGETIRLPGHWRKRTAISDS